MRIVDFDGNNLAEQPPADAQTVAGAPVLVRCRVIEDDPRLPFGQVRAAVNWADGSLSTVYSAHGTLTIQDSRLLPAGHFVVTVTAQNYATPPAFAQVNFGVNVRANEPVQVFDRILFGPILPRDGGNPNAMQWNFNLSQDLFVVESALKNLLLTTKGERIMEPDFGTQLRYLLFEPNLAGIEAMVQAEIVTALNRWEPRLTLAGVTVERQERSVKLDVQVVSNMTQNQFSTTITFSQ